MGEKHMGEPDVDSSCLDALDMARDELRRIMACPGATDEIKAICERGIRCIDRRFPLIPENEMLRNEVARIEVYKARIDLLEDLLISAHVIAQRNGRDTQWDAFSQKLSDARIGSVTPRTFRILPDGGEEAA